MQRTVTLDQIASQCGLSRAAVSYALRGREGVSAQVRERVLAAARELGYRPNPLVAAHMSHVRSTRRPRFQASLAMLEFARTSQDPDALAIDERYLAGALRQSEELGFSLERFRLDFSAGGLASVFRILRARGVRGVLVGPLPDPDGRVEFPWSEFAFVALGYSLTAPVLHRACYDTYNGCGVVLEELAARGYRRPGLMVRTAADARSHHYTLARFLAWQQQRPDAAQIPPLMVADWSHQRFQQWWDEHRPDAVISAAPLVPEWLRQMGRGVGSEVGVAAQFRLGASPVSGMDQNFEDVGAAAVELLATQILRNETGIPPPTQARLLFVPGRWVEGQTLRPRLAAAPAVRISSAGR